MNCSIASSELFLEKDMEKADDPDVSGIHALIQERKYDFYSFIRDHRNQIDDHVESCETCRDHMVGWSSHLPKLRARVTVHFPELADHHSDRMKQMERLARGQCLPCGCEVTHTAWTENQASAAFYKALADVLAVSEDQAENIPKGTRLQELPLSIKSLRRLRDKFWIPDGSSVSEEIRDAEEGDKVLQLPETIADFTSQILKLHSGMSYMECTEHWVP